MDRRIYRKTRYQNIYQHIKNKNYIIDMSNPKTSISLIDGKRIFDIETAKNIRDNKKIKSVKYSQIATTGTFNAYWDKYINYCENVQKQAVKTLKKKKTLYNAFFKCFIGVKLTKITRNDIIKFLKDIKTTDKQKNEVLKILKAFFNWCIDPEQEYLVNSPCFKIKNIKTLKPEMKYWLPEHFVKFMEVINKDINSNDIIDKYKAYRVKIFTLIGFKIGNRPGESLYIRFCDINKEFKNIKINGTKTEESQRINEISELVINEIEKYKNFLIQQMNYVIDEETYLFINIKSKKPLSDSRMREFFYEYSDKANVPRIRLYDLRHTFTTTMMSEGWQLYHIKEFLGHKSYNTTVDQYGHITNQVRKEMANTTDKYC